MKIVLRTFLLATLCILGSIIYGYSENSGHAFSSGSPGGRTGSPGNNGGTCTSCHSGTASPKAEVITSDVPAAGYIPGQTYSFSLTISEGSKTKYGFEARHEGQDRKAKGTLIITESDRTRQISSGPNASITHTFSGTAATANTNTWTWNWIAPETGTGVITVYAAMNATNSNGSDSGDKIYTTSLVLNEAETQGILSTKATPVRLYPNPTTDVLYVDGDLSDIQLFDITGAQVSAVVDLDMGAVEVHTLPKGIYTLTAKQRGESVVARFVKQ